MKNVLIGVIYRAHTAIDNFVHDVDPVLQTISKEKKECYIMGDYNIDLLKDDSDRPTHDYLDIYSHCLIPSILFPTRITEKSATIIDNILTNSDTEITIRILVTDITDHFPTILMTKSNNKNVPIKDSINEKCFAYKRTYTKDNISHLKQKLSQENWNDILHGIDAECDYNMFIERFNKLYDECIPLKKYKVNRRKIPQSPWITKGILKSITTKNKLYKEYLRSPNEQQAVKFKTYRNKLNNLIRKSKREYFYSKFRNTRNNIKETWKTINSIIGRRKNRSVQSTFKTEQAEKLTDPKKISDAFNTFFVDIGPKLASKIQHTGKNYFDYLNQPASSCMYTKPVVPEEVVKIIAKFNQNKSPGHNDIGNMIVKKVATEISKPLSTIFNCSLKTGVVPEQLKIAKVIPIYKKEDVEVFSNYRPVSVLPCFSKILERLMFNRCMDYIDKNSILNEKQFGFRTNHSTYMAIIELVDKVVSAVERSESTLGIFLDLSKAFDTIDHDILLYKLEYYGFRGIVLDWFKSYLNNRKQFVRYQACDSEYKNIKCGLFVCEIFIEGFKLLQ